MFPFYINRFRAIKIPYLVGYQQSVTQSTALNPKRTCDLFVSIFIERHSITTREKHLLENQFHKSTMEKEFENSMKSNFELLQEKVVMFSRNSTAGADIQLTFKELPRDIEEYSKHEIHNFKMLSSVKDDPAKDMHVRSNPQETLFLVTRQVGDNGKEIWLPPKHTLISNESIKQASERILKKYGNNLNIFVYGSAPISFYEYEVLDKTTQQKKIHKIFCILGKYLSGSVGENVIYQWHTAEQLQNNLNNLDYSHNMHLIQTYK